MRKRRNAYTTIECEAEIDIDEYLGDASTAGLIEELNDRELSPSDIAELNVLPHIKKKTPTIIDDLKTEIMLKGMDEKTIEQLEQFFNS